MQSGSSRESLILSHFESLQTTLAHRPPSLLDALVSFLTDLQLQNTLDLISTPQRYFQNFSSLLLKLHSLPTLSPYETELLSLVLQIILHIMNTFSDHLEETISAYLLPQLIQSLGSFVSSIADRQNETQRVLLLEAIRTFAKRAHAPEELLYLLTEKGLKNQNTSLKKHCLSHLTTFLSVLDPKSVTPSELEMVELVAALIQIRLDISGTELEEQLIKSQRNATHRLTALFGNTVKTIVEEFGTSQDRQELAACYREIMQEEEETDEDEGQEKEEEEEKEEQSVSQDESDDNSERNQDELQKTIELVKKDEEQEDEQEEEEEESEEAEEEKRESEEEEEGETTQRADKPEVDQEEEEEEEEDYSLGQNAFEQESEAKKESEPEEAPLPFSTIKIEGTSDNQLAFGLLPRDLVQQMETQDWKLLSEVIQKIEKHVNLEVTSFAPLKQTMSNFTGFLLPFVSHQNFKISLTAMKIFASILNSTELSEQVKTLAQQVVPVLFSRLKVKNIVVRQLVMRIFQAFIKVLSFAHLIKLLTVFLQSPNSIIREESLSLIICVFTLREDDAYLNYAKLTDLVQKLVYTNESDLKDKNRELAFEALVTVLAKTKQPDEFQQCVEQEGGHMYYQELLLRVQNASLPSIDSNLTLEFHRGNGQQVYYQYGFGKGESNRNYRAQSGSLPHNAQKQYPMQPQFSATASRNPSMMSTGFIGGQIKGFSQIHEQRQTYLPSAIGTSSEFKKGMQRNPSAGRISQQSTTNPTEHRAPIHIESGTSYQPSASMKPVRGQTSLYGLSENDDLYSQYSVPSPKMSSKKVEEDQSGVRLPQLEKSKLNSTSKLKKVSTSESTTYIQNPFFPYENTAIPIPDETAKFNFSESKTQENRNTIQYEPGRVEVAMKSLRKSVSGDPKVMMHGAAAEQKAKERVHSKSRTPSQITETTASMRSGSQHSYQPKRPELARHHHQNHQHAKHNSSSTRTNTFYSTNSMITSAETMNSTVSNISDKLKILKSSRIQSASAHPRNFMHTFGLQQIPPKTSAEGSVEGNVAENAAGLGASPQYHWQGHEARSEKPSSSFGQRQDSQSSDGSVGPATRPNIKMSTRRIKDGGSTPVKLPPVIEERPTRLKPNITSKRVPIKATIPMSGLVGNGESSSMTVGTLDANSVAENSPSRIEVKPYLKRKSKDYLRGNGANSNSSMPTSDFSIRSASDASPLKRNKSERPLIDAKGISPYKEKRTQSGERRPPLSKMKTSESKPKLGITGFGGIEEVQYLSSKELEPLKHPEAEWKKVIKLLSNPDSWSEQFQGLNIVKRMVGYHCSLISNSTIQPVVTEISKLAKSLRSSVAKNALLTLNELFQYLNRQMEPYLDNLMIVLLKRATDTNVFISDEALKAMISACQFCNESRILAAILTMSTNRSNPMKVKVALTLEAIVRKLGNKIVFFKENDKLITVLANNLSQASAEVRNIARRSFQIMSQEIFGKADFHRYLQRLLSESSYSKVKSVMEQGTYQSGEGLFMGISSSVAPLKSQKRAVGKPPSSQNVGQSELGATNGSSNSGSDKFELKTSGISFTSPTPPTNFTRSTQSAFKGFEQRVDPALLEELRILKQEAASSDWKRKNEAMSELYDWWRNMKHRVEKSSTVVVEITDIVMRGLTDNNTKVVVNCQGILASLLKQMHPQLVLKNLNPLLSTVMANCASTNTNIRTNGQNLLNALISNTCNYQLVQPFVHLISFGNARVKPLLISKLANILGNVHETKPHFIEKYVAPLFYKLLEDNKMEVRGQVMKLGNQLKQTVGWDCLLANAHPSKISKLREMLLRLD